MKEMFVFDPPLVDANGGKIREWWTTEGLVTRRSTTTEQDLKEILDTLMPFAYAEMQGWVVPGENGESIEVAMDRWFGTQAPHDRMMTVLRKHGRLK